MGEPRGHAYRGETRLFLFQNLHRYFLYLAFVFLIILATDVVYSSMWPDGFGVSVGTLILTLNVALLGVYTFSCHSIAAPGGWQRRLLLLRVLQLARHRLWKGFSVLNRNHMMWAWLSLFTVALADLYVWMVASGCWTDPRVL